MTQYEYLSSCSAYTNGYLSIIPLLEHKSKEQLPPPLRNGIILPLYFSLAGQLCAIAQVLDLPSTEGLSIYLYEDGQGYAGPNIGASVWPMVWHRNFNSLDNYNSTLRRQKHITSSSSRFVVARVELLIEGKAAVHLSAENITDSVKCHQALDYTSGAKIFGNA